jgi:hypothetical protein
MPFDGTQLDGTPLNQTQLNQTAADLLAAKRYLEIHGWMQGNFGMDGGPRCILGAMRSVAGDRWDRFIEILGAATGRHCCLPGYWNDQPGRTIEEVYALFDKAIATAMEQKVNACGLSVVLTTAGRPDDPRSVKLARIRSAALVS